MREKTKYLGVYSRKSSIRKHLNKPDVCFEITFKRGNKKIWEKVGWASEGYNPKLASIVRAERIRSIRHDEELPQDKKNIPLFRDAAKDFLKWAEQNRSCRGSHEEGRYRKYLKFEFDDKRLDEISSFDLERLKSKLSETLAQATVNHVLSDFREIFNKAVVWKNLNLTNPIKKVKMLKLQNSRVRFYTQEEVNLLLDALPYKQLHDIALLSLRTGLRLMEAANLKGQDLDFKNDIIRVLNPKNREQNSVVYMTSDIKSILRAYNTPPHDYVFKDNEGNQITQPWASELYSRTIKKLGFNKGVTDRRQKLTFHSLRHTFASWLALSGEQLPVIKELMRHKDIKMTMRYAHLIPSHKRRAVEKIATGSWD